MTKNLFLFHTMMLVAVSLVSCKSTSAKQPRAPDDTGSKQAQTPVNLPAKSETQKQVDLPEACQEKLQIKPVPNPKPVDPSNLGTSAFKIYSIPITNGSTFAWVSVRKHSSADLVLVEICQKDASECTTKLVRNPEDDITLNPSQDPNVLFTYVGTLSKGSYNISARSCVWDDLAVNVNAKSKVYNFDEKKLVCGDAISQEYIQENDIDEKTKKLFLSIDETYEKFHSLIYNFVGVLKKNISSPNINPTFHAQAENILNLRENFNLWIESSQIEQSVQQAVFFKDSKTELNLVSSDCESIIDPINEIMSKPLMPPYSKALLEKITNIAASEKSDTSTVWLKQQVELMCREQSGKMSTSNNQEKEHCVFPDQPRSGKSSYETFVGGAMIVVGGLGTIVNAHTLLRLKLDKALQYKGEVGKALLKFMPKSLKTPSEIVHGIYGKLLSSFHEGSLYFAGYVWSAELNKYISPEISGRDIKHPNNAGKEFEDMVKKHKTMALAKAEIQERLQGLRVKQAIQSETINEISTEERHLTQIESAMETLNKELSSPKPKFKSLQPSTFLKYAPALAGVLLNGALTAFGTFIVSNDQDVLFLQEDTTFKNDIQSMGEKIYKAKEDLYMAQSDLFLSFLP